MGQPTKRDIRRERVFVAAGQHEGWGAKRIKVDLMERRGGNSDAISERTVGNYLKEWHLLSSEQRREWRRAKWPEAIENGALPPEASRSLLDLLRWMNDRGLPLPTVRYARLLALVRQADPDNELVLAHLVAAAVLVHAELADDAESRRMVEWFLTYRPWRGEEEEAAYNRAVGDGTAPEFHLPPTHLHAEIADYPDLWAAVRIGRFAFAESLGIETDPRKIEAMKQGKKEEKSDGSKRKKGSR